MKRNEQLEGLLREFAKELAATARPGVAIVNDMIEQHRRKADRKCRKCLAPRTGHGADKSPTAS